MYAVIKTGGKQYRVAKDDVIVVERLSGEAGDSIELDQVLMLDDGKASTVGTPLVDGARVAATVVDQSRGDKIIVFKKKRRKHYRRRNGHRQDLSKVTITEILTGGKKPSKKAAAKKEAKAEDKPAKKEAPAKKAAPAKEEKPAEAPAGALFTAPEGAADDLKKISGVGPVLEKKLNDLGITQYAQVAAFTAEDIAKVDDALSFKGRIERDDWLGQAKKLAAGE